MESGKTQEICWNAACRRIVWEAKLHCQEDEAELALNIMLCQHSKWVYQMRKMAAEAFANGETMLEGRKRMSEDLEAIRTALSALESYWTKLAEAGERLQDEQKSAAMEEHEISPTLMRLPPAVALRDTRCLEQARAQFNSRPGNSSAVRAGSWTGS